MALNRSRAYRSVMPAMKSVIRLSRVSFNIYDYGEDILPFVVMEYVEGESLESLRKKKGKLSMDELFAIVK